MRCMRTDNGKRVVLCFDRDRTVSVNPHPSSDKPAVPLGWVQYWAHMTDTHVWATGFQLLRHEAKIPGIEEAEVIWEEHSGGEDYGYEEEKDITYRQPSRRDGLRLIQDIYQSIYPDDEFLFIVVDDIDVSDLSREGPWIHHYPWDFYRLVREGHAHVEEPPETSYPQDGIEFNKKGDSVIDYNEKAVVGDLCHELRNTSQESNDGIES